MVLLGWERQEGLYLELRKSTPTEDVPSLFPLAFPQRHPLHNRAFLQIGLSPLHWAARRSNQSILKEMISEYSLGRAGAEAEASILWPPDAKSRLTGKDPDPGKD